MLDTQRAALVRRHAGQVRLCTQGSEAMQHDDLTVVRLLADVRGDLADASPVAEIVPERGPTIAHSFDLPTEVGPAVASLSTLGAVGLPPPDLQGYSDPKPKYRVGTAIAPNRPVGELPVGRYGLSFSATALPNIRHKALCLMLRHD